MTAEVAPGVLDLQRTGPDGKLERCIPFEPRPNHVKARLEFFRAWRTDKQCDIQLEPSTDLERVPVAAPVASAVMTLEMFGC